MEAPDESRSGHICCDLILAQTRNFGIGAIGHSYAHLAGRQDLEMSLAKFGLGDWLDVIGPSQPGCSATSPICVPPMLMMSP